MENENQQQESHLPPLKKKPLPNTDGVDIRPIRTFQDDMAQAAKQGNETAISMSVKEAEKKQQQEDALRRQKQQEAEKRKLEEQKELQKKRQAKEREVREKKEIEKQTQNKPQPQPQPIVSIPDNKKGYPILVLLSILFILGGIGVLGYFYWQSRPSEIQRAIIDTLIIADRSVVENIEGADKESVEYFIETQRAQSQPYGTITNLEFVQASVTGETSVGPQDLLRKLGSRAPATLTRAMSGDHMVGLISLEESSVPFWIVEVESFENAFGGVLDWETFMQEDIAGMFSNKTQALTPEFKDVVIHNRDVRILYNDQGEEILAHAFLDQNTLIFTANREAFAELFPLYISSKQIR